MSEMIKEKLNSYQQGTWDPFQQYLGIKLKDSKKKKKKK
mgnify:CR=1 FL=1